MNFIIYEDMKKYSDIYKKVIFKLMGKNNINYNIIEINQYNEETYKRILEIKGNKIYLLDIEVPGKFGIELAREIRQTGDWTSPIVIISNHDEFKSVGYTRKILMLDFILKDDDMENTLFETLNLAREILLSKKTFSFKEKGEIYQIPLSDILYIEKSINDNLSIIVTENNIYKVRNTIQNLESELSIINNFFRTHRSYLVNLKNIRYINFDEGEISFVNDKIALLSRSKKKKLKERISDFQNN